MFPVLADVAVAAEVKGEDEDFQDSLSNHETDFEIVEQDDIDNDIEGPEALSSVDNTLNNLMIEQDDISMNIGEPEPILTDDNILNILIIGETGVGKSTFINAFANYLKFESLAECEKGHPTLHIPCKFTVTDENYELREVIMESDENELNELGKSSTKDPRDYIFPISNGEKFVRLIDTPGIGDTRGVHQDNLNCEKIINHIASIKSLHGIMFLLMPNSSKITVLFEFCMKQIMSKLEKSASNNLLFVFTNTRGTGYRPGETLPCLRLILKEIGEKPPFVKIPLDKANIFCLDNEAFRYLAAIANGIQFTPKERQYYGDSWEKSSEESWRMIIRITGDHENKPLQPHNVEQTLCVNESRNLIHQLKQPLADITEHIQSQLIALKRHGERLALDNLDIKELKKNLFIPIIDIEVIEIPQPVTVCTNLKCAKIYEVREVKKWHYEQRCHNPCYLKNVPEEMIGTPKLVNCAAMDGTKKCKMCHCDFSTHMHIYYESITVDRTIENDNVKKSLNSKESLKQEKEKIIKNMNKLKEELESEHKMIIRYVAKFAKFLQQNAITPYNDVYKQYIHYLMERENSFGDTTDKEMIAYYTRCLVEYDEAMKLFDDAVQMKNTGEVTPEYIKESVNDLFKLKNTGKKIEELYNSQQCAWKSENHYNKINNNSKKSKYKKNPTFVSTCASNVKNFFIREQAYCTQSDEDNKSSISSTSQSTAGGWNFWNKKKKPSKKNKKTSGKDSSSEDDKVVAQMAQEASVALAGLSYDLKNL